MTAPRLDDPVRFARGPALRNRFVLGPLTNQQSHADGTLSDDEFDWLVSRAAAGYGLTMTCAAHVQPSGQGFPGQLGIFGDHHLAGLTRLAAAIRAEGSVAAVQLHHAGIRADKTLVPAPVGASDDAPTNGRALTTDEVEVLRDDFIAAARRAEKAGFDGVEVHGAHGYMLTQFLSSATNRRDDRYGGGLDNRFRLLREIVDGIRATCGPDFQLGVRLSTERFGLELAEMREVAARLLAADAIDYLDLSLWDVFKEPEEAAFKGRSLLSYFAELPRGRAKLGAAGKIMGSADAARLIEAGCDFAMIGRAGILRRDFPQRALRDPDYVSPVTPVMARALIDEGISTSFLAYLRGFPGFVVKEAEAA